MAHAEQMHFFSSVIARFPNHFVGRVLDVGSLDINGGPHTLISPEEYLGVDVSGGPNISLVCKGEDISLPSGYFDVAMSSECFEHNSNWRATLHNMIRMTKPAGLIVWTCATVGRREHGTTRSDGGFAAPLNVAKGVEYYHNVSKGDVVSCLDETLFDHYSLFVNDAASDLYFFGIKKVQLHRRFANSLSFRVNTLII